MECSCGATPVGPKERNPRIIQETPILPVDDEPLCQRSSRRLARRARSRGGSQSSGEREKPLQGVREGTTKERRELKSPLKVQPRSSFQSYPRQVTVKPTSNGLGVGDSKKREA